MHTIVRIHSNPAPASTVMPQQLRPACAGTDPKLFFAHTLSTLQIARAKAICATCQLMDSCRQGALDRGEEYGVWGGLSEDDRRRIKRRVARERAAAKAA